MITQTANWYFCKRKQGSKYSWKGISNNQNGMTWKRHMQAFPGMLDKAKNTSFRVHDQGFYEQNKLMLIAYYDKRYVLEDDIIHTRPLNHWKFSMLYINIYFQEQILADAFVKLYFLQGTLREKWKICNLGIFRNPHDQSEKFLYIFEIMKLLQSDFVNSKI